MSRLLLLVAVAAFTVMSIAHVTASEGEEAEARGSIRGRTLMATADRGRFPECQRNRTRCLDPNLKPDGPTCCSNRCVNTRIDTNHCGACSRPCRFNQGCCNARCVNLQTDPQNCGACGADCDEACEFGLCAYSGVP
ncbi:hypothetical protein MPTK1_5g11390 [Marchantia polymorpha subsp. ruderalis]|uniref:4Fe-4S ferredoxin-type domain-containing protein n=2 Tax=Marchantia polymorpha TaxID=3197 RepID=A0AAF6BH93_MARPO|nr:hypothetical protein MARPO_0093s0062 [Marchantia polymorpha]PTQ32991.1 hypothetical protein MARPO_0093s0062 [Marchantia polymorpha]BBN11377.1 hypothetical protein Mp_5g11390 [Marchantia polymorpha subsp. ruderalis]BBN11378.1 hypothetical protein Mp_5g11390 [Marchantia polymorpha subsp. ruderalis]|eukprot:PTQ32990.1 hypothetical protein MARPO_0093s0062 [Marchantia polymorpha]